MRTQIKLLIALVVALVVVLGFAWYTWPEQPPFAPMASTTSATITTATSSSASTSTAPSRYPPPSLGERQGIVTIDGQTIYVDLAQTEAQQELGLGQRASLGRGQGMLFIFPNDAQHMFWMKDMSFPIDMIWMSADGTIIYIQPNVAPSTYPAAFGPNGVSRYVLEVPANFAAQNNIKVGDRATLP